MFNTENPIPEDDCLGLRQPVRAEPSPDLDEGAQVETHGPHPLRALQKRKFINFIATFSANFCYSYCHTAVVKEIVKDY